MRAFEAAEASRQERPGRGGWGIGGINDDAIDPLIAALATG